MIKSPRCLCNSSLAAFAAADENAVFGVLCDSYHGNSDLDERGLEREGLDSEAVAGTGSILKELRDRVNLSR